MDFSQVIPAGEKYSAQFAGSHAILSDYKQFTSAGSPQFQTTISRLSGIKIEAIHHPD